MLYRPGGGGIHPPDEQLLQDHSYFIKMAGREVFKSAVLSMADACDQALRRAGWPTILWHYWAQWFDGCQPQ